MRPPDPLAAADGRGLRWLADRQAAPGTDRPRLLRTAARTVVRTASPWSCRGRGWTSDLDTSAEVFGRYYPDRAGQLREAVTLGRP